MAAPQISFAQDAENAQAAAPRPGVIVEEVRKEKIENQRVFAGRTEAVARVELIARVGGFLDPLKFSEGQIVEEGQTLFVIQKAPYEFAVEQRKANLESAKAQLDLAKLDFDRKEKLVARDTVSVSELDVARANQQEAQANVDLRQADLSLAELDLSYTEIKSPMKGKVGTARFKDGAYVTSQSGTLATVTKLDPMRVAFPVPQALMLQGQRLRVSNEDMAKLTLRLSDDSIYNHEGKIEYFDAVANPGTDTVTVHALFPNPDGLLFDQQLVDVIAEQRDTAPVLVVSQAALLIDQDGPYVLLVNDEDKVEQRRISVADQVQGKVIVQNGLKEGDLVITSGIQKVRPGVEVNAKLAGQ
ncbi:efflux RND transporter periplasmic adaptor subunit [Rhodobacteraceae bacterium RKSG542]|uniref:efflux RND transporter periplasmic adaptor subunit n=1 Tax=Pseudovibrio flavus TaxID=2529854 RepID=UPI0012BCCFA0|nr:efflux RND transporter periplasmic adaptor subunit [Pseudovibrio flavus]MTI17690.1 efflux RND transporter periplasmic adaptor subunit [Pseudovibrio flavus]